MPKIKIAFIINPISGKKKQRNILHLLKTYLDTDKYEYSALFSEYQGHMKDLTTEAISNGHKVIITVGGDGSVNEVFPQLVNTDLILGIIPYGSGNGLARCLNIPSNPKEAIELINLLPITKIDSAEINQRPFINVSGIGFDARVAKRFAKSSKRGLRSYIKIVLKTYLSHREKKYHLRTEDGQMISTRALMVCFANSNQFGNNFFIAPDAKINDGLLNVCIVKKIPFWILPLSIILVLLKKIDRSKYYDHFQAPKVWLTTNKRRMVNIDGEPVKMGKEMEIKIYPLSVNVICPKQSS